MSVAAQRALRSAIEEKKFSRVYYLHGDDDFRKDDAVAQLVSAAVDAGTRDFNFETLRGNDADAAAMSAALHALPMLAARRVVVIRDVASLRKAARAELMRYLATPADETVLVLVAPGGAKPDAEIAEHAVEVGFPPLGDDDVAAWIGKHAKKLGGEISGEAAALLAGAVRGDLAFAAGDVDKLLSYAHGRRVESADVEAIVGVRVGETLADLLDAVAARDPARAVNLVDVVLAQPGNSAVRVVMALTVQTLAMAWGRAVRNRGLPAQRLESEFYGFLKAGSSFVGRPWGSAVKCWSGNLPKWSDRDLDRAIGDLVAADLALKDSKFSSDDTVLHGVVMSLCAPARARTAA